MKWTTGKLLAAISVVLVTISFQIQVTNGSNILGLFISPSPSHAIVHMSVVKALAEKGHNVTVVINHKPKVTHKSIRTIVIPPSQEQADSMETTMIEMSKKNSILRTMKNLFTSNLVLMQLDLLKDKRFTSLYDNPDTKFDLIIMGYFVNDFQLAVAAKFKSPVILSWMNPSMELIDQYVGNPGEFAYVPNMLLPMKVGDHMNFLTRVKNMITGIFFKLVRHLIDFFMERFYKQLLPADNKLPTYHDMKKNVSLVFCNGHFSEGPIRPNVPAMVEIGGIQIKDKPDPLPEDIEKFLNKSKQHGVILFSMGSNLKSKQMRPEIVKLIFKTLSALKQNVIWKWDDLDKSPGNAPNILYKNWLPQDDILAHPNIKLFITHAGKGGLTEAIYHGVPMVALPAFGDQSSNAEKMESSGYGLQLNLLELTKDVFKNTVTEVLNNPVYANNVKKFSELYRDRPMTAKETVVFWSEYVIRHHGAAHIQSPVVHMNAIQSYSLDVIAFLCLVLYIVWRLLILIFRFTFKFVLIKLGWCTTKNAKNRKAKKQ